MSASMYVLIGVVIAIISGLGYYELKHEIKSDKAVIMSIIVSVLSLFLWPLMLVLVAGVMLFIHLSRVLSKGDDTNKKDKEEVTDVIKASLNKINNTNMEKFSHTDLSAVETTEKVVMPNEDNRPMIKTDFEKEVEDQKNAITPEITYVV